MGALQILFNVENYTLEIVHEQIHEDKKCPVMCGNVSIRHRIFYVSGLDFLSRSMASSMARLINAVALSPIASA